MNIDIIGSKDFKPHLMFLKLSEAPALRWKGFRKISADLYTVYEDSLFGTEIFGQIDLCAMYEKKQDSGYYHYECSINICPASSEKQEDLQTDDLKENVIGASLNDGAFGHIGKTPLNQQSSSNE
ncbi:A-kinase anchor protein 7-like isoform X1 [Heteronotia binoei]|uniref:A-kinase anchor protein 7-like isoform X1 n=1 Tax=Heteronotia binoei TaxID=13085 RepID=UPI00292E4289|nr:A-kinase anchor protein 7-like isoform X1 [Heteronotia binoei]XP_060098962.1 A-kinase anchor protein 7-like isoform X1 [Heteronotia binoei]